MQLAEFKKNLFELLKLSLPILTGNIGQMLINLGDVYVAGHYSTLTLGAISVASAIFMTFIIAGLGLMSAITPVLANYRGERKPVKHYLSGTIIFSLILSLIFFTIITCFIPLMDKIGLNPSIAYEAKIYMKISAYSVFGIFIFSGLKEFLQSYEIVKLPNFMVMTAGFINIGLNFLLVYGYGIIPELGIKGLAYASLIVRSALGIILFIFCMQLLNKINFKGFTSYIKALIQTGLPIAGAAFIEFSGFNVVAVLVGKYAPLYAACHNIIISIVSMVYMLPFSLSCALSVKVGYSNGAKDLNSIKKLLQVAFATVFVYSIIVVLIYLFFKKQLMAIFSSDTHVIEIGAQIMLLTAAFTLFDAMQSICAGALKGLKETTSVMAISFCGYILISIPIGYILAEKFHLLLQGFWIGLTFGIFTSSIVGTSILIYKYFKLKKSFQMPK